MDLQYSQKVMDLFENPKNVGSMDEHDAHVGTGVKGSPACGDMMRFQIKVNDGKIEDAKFKTFGCCAAIASSCLATEKIIGRSLEDAAKLTNKELADELELPPVKVHCSVLAEDAIKAAIEDYQNKQKS